MSTNQHEGGGGGGDDMRGPCRVQCGLKSWGTRLALTIGKGFNVIWYPRKLISTNQTKIRVQMYRYVKLENWDWQPGTEGQKNCMSATNFRCQL